jgi:hypothetical protein
VGSSLNTEEVAVKKKKIPAGSIPLMLAGDLILARNTNRDFSQVFRRYEALLEAFANMDRDERIMNYKFLIALMLTSHAKKIQSVEERKQLFDLKNQLYLSIANNKAVRRKIGFRYLVSKNFRVIEFCDNCKRRNTEEGLERHKWKFCRDCKVDRKFYNVLAMTHKFAKGNVSLFLSNDLVSQVEGLTVTPKGELEKETEEGRYDKFHYNVKNLDIFTLDSIKKAHAKLLTQ